VASGDAVYLKNLTVKWSRERELAAPALYIRAAFMFIFFKRLGAESGRLSKETYQRNERRCLNYNTV
jgi:hypothetical protein